MPRETVNCRFAVGSVVSARSAVWRGFSTGNDVYFVQGGLKEVKYSLHASGRCRVAFVNADSSGEDRAFQKWERAPTPDEGVAYAMTARFRTDTLSTAITTDTSKPITWVKAAPPGKVTVLGFGFSRAPENELRKVLEANNHGVVYSCSLPNGEQFVITRTETPNTEKDMTARLGMGDYVVSQHDPNVTGRPARISMFVPRKNIVHVWENGAYRLTPDLAQSKPTATFTMNRVIRSSKSKS